MRLPTSVLVLFLVASCAWSLLEDLGRPSLADRLADPDAVGTVTVAGHLPIEAVAGDRFTVVVEERPVVVHGTLDETGPGDVVSLRVRIRADGALDALEVAEHAGRPTKIWISAAAAGAVALLCAARLAWDPTERRLTVRCPTS